MVSGAFSLAPEALAKSAVRFGSPFLTLCTHTNACAFLSYPSFFFFSQRNYTHPFCLLYPTRPERTVDHCSFNSLTEPLNKEQPAPRFSSALQFTSAALNSAPTLLLFPNCLLVLSLTRKAKFLLALNKTKSHRRSKEYKESEVIDLAKLVDRLTRSGRKGTRNGSKGKGRGRDRARRSGGVIRRRSLIMRSEGLRRVALIVALKYIRDRDEEWL